MTSPRNRAAIFGAILSGLLLTGSFPGFGVPALAWTALAPLLFVIRNLPAGERFRLGMATGLVHYLTLMYWLTITMQTYGGLPWYTAIGFLFLLSAYLAFYIGAFAALLLPLSPTPFRCLWMAPVLWVALEYVRAKALTGFPWELLGYSQYSALRVIQISDIFGVYGISFLVAAVNAGLLAVWLFFTKENWRRCIVTGKTASWMLFGGVLLLAVTVSYGTWRMDTVRRDMAEAPKIRAAVIQGNIAQNVKWNPAFQNASVETYLQLSAKAALETPKLIVWPETATPFYFFGNKELTERILKGITAANAFFIVGSPSAREHEDGMHYYNSAYLMSPQGALLGKYDKAHLVPFGEYVPCRTWLPFVEKMVTAIGDFSAGQSGAVIPSPVGKIGIQICYEMIFPALSRLAARNEAGFLVNITNDAWFGKSSAPYQHFSMAVLRAVENRRSVIRAANTGISGFVDPVGGIVAQTPLFEEAALTRSMPVMTTETVYTRWGDWFPAGCCIWVIIIVIIRIIPRRRNG